MKNFEQALMDNIVYLEEVIIDYKEKNREQEKQIATLQEHIRYLESLNYGSIEIR